MSSAIEGWYVDPSTGTNLRFWNGSTWTDEVAPLPGGAAHASQVGLFFASTAHATTADHRAGSAADIWDTGDTKATDGAGDTGATGGAGDTGATGGADDTRISEAQNPPLDTELERTLLTRRELRARRAANPDLDDSPRHLPPMTPPAAANEGRHAEEELEIPPKAAAVGDTTDSRERRQRVMRLSVLLGILAVVSSVAILTEVTL